MPSSKVLLYNALAATIAAAGVRADSCTDGPFGNSRNQIFGKYDQGDRPTTKFCHSLWNVGLVVSKVEVWGNNYHIAGVQLTYSDGTTAPVQGNTVFGNDKHLNNGQNPDNHYHDIINIPDGGKVDVMKASTNKDGNALGYLYIEAGGKKLEVGTSKPKVEMVDVGTGIFMGVMGSTNAFPTAWTPLFMGSNNDKVEMIDLKFDQDLDEVNKKQQGLTQVTLSEVYIRNSNPLGSNGTAQTWSFAGSTAKKTSQSMSTSDSHTFGISEAIEVGGKIGVPLVAEGTVKSTTTMSYQYSHATDKSTGSEDSQTLSWNQGSSQTSDLLQAGHAKHCSATTIEGNYDGDYTSTNKINVGGKDYTYTQKGTFKSVSYSTAFTDCKDVLIKDIPSGANITEAGVNSMQHKRFFRV